MWDEVRLRGRRLRCLHGDGLQVRQRKSESQVNISACSHLPVNACLAPVCSMHGLAVTTVEGIGSTKKRLHPVQERIAKAHGSQCGFCTPGIVMSMYTLLRNMPKPSMKDLEVAFQGNLCRCTGYRPIIEGYKTFTEDWELMQQNGQMTNGNGCPMGEECCKKKKQKDPEEVLFETSEFTPMDPSQEPIFPPELKESNALDLQTLYFKNENVIWFRPTHIKDLLELKHSHPDAKIIVGNTEVGVEVKFKHFFYPTLINPTSIPEMVDFEVTSEGVTLGASLTLQQMEINLRQLIRHEVKHKTRIFQAIVEMLHWFAGKQIRSVAAIGGNIMTGSPISDLNPIFMAAKIGLNLQSKSSKRTVKMDEHFFTGYRRNIVDPTEILVSINIPFTKPSQFFYAYKQARRRDDDIAIVNSAINVSFDDNQLIENIDLAFGGMAPTTVLALKTSKHLRGLPWNEETLEKAYGFLMEDLPLPPSAPGGMIQYRRALPLSFFFRSYLRITQDLYGAVVDRRDLSALQGFHYTVPKSSQYFQVVPETQQKTDTVGRPIPHLSAYKQAAGEAIYCDDIPYFENELYLAFVYSTKAHANVLSIDPSEALAMTGVAGFISAKDLKYNQVGPVMHDEEIFISKTVTSQGQFIGAIVAEDQTTAQRAARKVKVEYKELDPIIVTIEDAIKHKSFFSGVDRKVANGDVDEALRNAPHIIEGDCRIGYQEHFYLETQCTVAVPKKEDDEFEIYCSTQNPSEVTTEVARILGVHQNRIVTKVKRLGGGFGGKESRAAMIAVPAAVAASIYNRPVRIMLDRDEDMMISGGRHPFLFKYKVGFDDDGRLLGCDMDIYNNAGYSRDLSIAVMERALLHFENSYKIPNARAVGYVCKTNLPSNTAFRGFGGPQAMFVAETILREVAEYLMKDVVEVGRLNLYAENDVTPSRQTLTNCTLSRCWDECIQSSDYARRKRIIDEYNKENRWKKRGISVVPTKFGIAFTLPFLNQGGALVLIYRDGSVLISHGGTEMGQGLHTKMIQVASKALGIPISMIHIVETATDKVPNTSPTAASASSDLNGMAILDACNTINERLKVIKSNNPNGTWEEWINAAYFERISLSATGFYKTPGLGYSWETNSGNAFNYYTCGVSITEVEVDCLTGDHQVLRTDIVMDLGDSLNPAIDVGQIEGGFMQGYGLFVMEEMMYSPTGTIFTRGPGAYKIPGFGDIPSEFNVSLLKGASNPRAVYSSKAVGEPPLFLACSALFAIREAVKSARIDAGLEGPFKLDAPATAAKIRMGCQDQITAKLDVPKPGSFVPWNVTA
ncbi:PREDICTED: xanthine dehydrogenase isoform X2 [Nicrophorus vespilloides]|uniref:Xanthine dehydrogenase isoform X2 n=1 Tax=Nicrophorus vespilloides TaxID=110193 RepID=A0ABM1M174_NICVS|nr:PREDICTED: xanthine dehydrogenase isoform X2 [Nicrophorus vespilloides]